MIRDWKNAPSLILALANEIADLKTVLLHLQNARDIMRITDSLDSNFTAALDQQLRKAQAELHLLDNLSRELSNTNGAARRRKCLMKKSDASNMQVELRDVRTKIRDLLLAHNL